MPGFAGIDCSEFPGGAEMQWLKANTNLAWCGYYLGPAPSHASRTWMGQQQALKAAGWGVAPVYVGQQIRGPGRHNVCGPQGRLDGADAAQLLRADGFKAGSYVYLDLEDGAPFAEPRIDYVMSWIDAVTAAGFAPGVYCSHDIALDIHNLRPSVRIWAFRVDTTDVHPFPGTNFPDSAPAGCGYPGAFIWQLGQNCRLTLPGAPVVSFIVDLNSSLTPDPGAP